MQNFDQNWKNCFTKKLRKKNGTIIFILQVESPFLIFQNINLVPIFCIFWFRNIDFSSKKSFLIIENYSFSSYCFDLYDSNFQIDKNFQFFWKKFHNSNTKILHYLEKKKVKNDRFSKYAIFFIYSEILIFLIDFFYNS